MDSESRQTSNPEGYSSSAPPAAGVSVVIPARDAEATIIPTLDSIFAQDYAGPIEVIVADGSKTPKMAELIRQAHPWVKIIPNPAKTLVPGANAAFREATGDFMVRCDAHVVLPPSYIRQALETLERTGAANVGGRQLAVGATLFERAVAMAMTTPLGVGDSRHRLGGKEGASDTAFLGVFSRATLEETGGYDSRLIRNEDYELNYRLRQRGQDGLVQPGTGGAVPAPQHAPGAGVAVFQLWPEQVADGAETSPGHPPAPPGRARSGAGFGRRRGAGGGGRFLVAAAGDAGGLRPVPHRRGGGGGLAAAGCGGVLPAADPVNDALDLGGRFFPAGSTFPPPPPEILAIFDNFIIGG